MIKLKRVERTTVEYTTEDVVCNFCGKSCRDKFSMNFEHVECMAHWGFGSKRDTVSTLFHVCEPCFETRLLPMMVLPPTETSSLFGYDVMREEEYPDGESSE